MSLANQQLIRENKSWEEHLNAISKRYPYSGQDDLTGKWYEQVYPCTDIMCMRCAKKYHNQGKEFVRKGNIVQRMDLCRFCGQMYSIPSNFVEVHLLLGRDTYKRYSRLDQYLNTNDSKEINKIKTEEKIKQISYRNR